ncbi:uncharacterized protein LOC6565669 [Drosophila grimshawi]|uniref:GH24265 n=1 Tax=Drosophila grimshawi TaxID=7222 RepID=B4JMU9_DROGR|nr:uncharacterized protein LOC6565669 [Drosophila grimshawi]EDV92042.1 GH24265 [Drosophila grimshawi]
MFVGLGMEPSITCLRTLGYLEPINPSRDLTILDWDDNVEMSLLLVIGSVILMQLLLLIYVVLSTVQPCVIYRQQRNESNRRRYRNFIVHRLLAQLDQALMRRPDAGEELNSCIEAKQRAESAIRLFWCDAAKVLYPEHELDSLTASDMYFVLLDEEAELNSAGYASVDFNVTASFLESLMYPERANTCRTNQIKS